MFAIYTVYPTTNTTCNFNSRGSFHVRFVACDFVTQCGGRLMYLKAGRKSPLPKILKESHVFFEVIPGVLGRSVNFNIT